MSADRPTPGERQPSAGQPQSGQSSAAQPQSGQPSANAGDQRPGSPIKRTPGERHVYESFMGSDYEDRVEPAPRAVFLSNDTALHTPRIDATGPRRGMRYRTPVAQCNEVIDIFNRAIAELTVMQDNCRIAVSDPSLSDQDKRKSLYSMRDKATSVMNVMLPAVYKMPQDTQEHPYFEELIEASDRLRQCAQAAIHLYEQEITGH